MKNKHPFKPLRWLLDVVPKGIAVFAIAAGTYYAYAEITYPPQPYVVTGVVGQFVGVTADVYDGSPVGYQNVNAFCSGGTGDLSGSHVCTAMELISSYNVGNPVIVAQGGRAWFNNGPPGYITNVVNDCTGWNSTSSTVFGAIWKFSSPSSASLSPCNISNLPFSCCK
ncbi:MAG: hypothetical protein V1908_01585 [Candidatus Peregrinibacteria bacterium]